MNILSWSEIRKLSAAEMQTLLPITITIEGVPLLALDNAADVLTLSDLHPGMQSKLRGLSALGRAGMPPPQKVYASEVKQSIEG